MYQVGDELILRIEEDFGYRDKTFREAKVQVIGTGIDQYICYVPHYLSVPQSFRMNTSHMKWFDFDKKFLNEMGVLVNDSTCVARVIKSIPGAKCDRCQEFIADAVKHVGVDLKCRACRENPYR